MGTFMDSKITRYLAEIPLSPQSNSDFVSKYKSSQERLHGNMKGLKDHKITC
jgi:hypothetical protein